MSALAFAPSAVTEAHFLMLSDVKFEKPAKLRGYTMVECFLKKYTYETKEG
jgi:hypothetical protein